MPDTPLLSFYRSGRPAEAGHARRWYLWITVVYNSTYSVALYALVLFHLGHARAPLLC